ELASLEVGPVRARALLLLSRLQRAEPSAEMLDEALAEADDRARAEILAEKAFTAALGDASQVSDAREWAAEAVALAQASGNSTLMASCVTTFAWMEALAGNDIEPLLDTLERNVTDKLAGYDNPDRLRAVRAVWRGEVDRARELLVSLVARAREREEDWSEAVFVLHRFELEQRVGDWVEAERVLDEFRLAAASHPAAATTAIHRCRAFVAAARGDLGVVMTTTDAVRDPELEASGWQRLEAIRARGFAALVAGDPASAVTDLAAVADAVEAGGVCDPGAFPYGGDLIEALVAAGRLTDARAVLQRFETVCSEQSHPWGLAIAARCRGIVLAQEGDERAAVCSFNEAIERQSRLGLLFDLARSQLGLGTLYRRSRRIADARALLDSAAVMFDQLGSPPLAARARDEIARLGGHRRGVGLTATEERVADLVAQGLTNKEIATTLFVTVNTVEAHLTRTYTKLGIHSRSELVRRRLLREPGRGSKGS
ncbi:MAG TPA: helix-turn-helix transcriptional regulator, partial [Acidimicrobiales bacterium]|nr:helix-turn-helix transcriptional regulator [Acidimicrobiales bacterium]